jgi:proteasome assembly chaperone (PAC2) family protein
MSGREVKQIASIESDDFYIYNFPGSMEVAALFRPHVVYEEGIVKELDLPANVFFADESANLIFFTGKEPNLKWEAFADAVFELAKTCGVKRIIFIGSFGGSVPHTREPRLFGSVSHPHLKETLKQYGLRTSDYEGPGSFATLLLSQAMRHEMEMLSFVAEIPGYLEGTNPLSIEAISKRLARILNMPLDGDRLRKVSNRWEAEVTAAVEKDGGLAATIRKLEEEYDNQLITSDDNR